MKLYFAFLANNNRREFFYSQKSALKRGIIYFSLKIVENFVIQRKELEHQ